MSCAFLSAVVNIITAVVGNRGIGEGNSALSIDAAALKGTVVSGDRHILDGYPSLRINAAPVAITCIPRGGRLVAGDRGVGDRNSAGVKVDIDPAAVLSVMAPPSMVKLHFSPTYTPPPPPSDAPAVLSEMVPPCMVKLGGSI